MLRLIVVKGAAVSFMLVLAGCGSARGITASSDAGTTSAASATALCQAAADQWGGNVAGAFVTTVAEVRAQRRSARCSRGLCGPPSG